MMDLREVFNCCQKYGLNLEVNYHESDGDWNFTLTDVLTGEYVYCQKLGFDLGVERIVEKANEFWG